MGAKSRRKGGRLERDIVQRHRDAGIAAHRVPLSGAVAGYKGDVILDGLGDLRCEVKGRGSGDGFKVLERWLGDFDLLFLRRDRQDPLVVLPWRTWLRVTGRATDTAGTTDK